MSRGSNDELSYPSFTSALKMPKWGKGGGVDLKKWRATRSFNLCVGKGKILGCEMRGFQNVHGGLGGLGLFHFLPKSQLAAGGIDIVTFFAADGSPNACGEERPAEKMNCLFRGTFVGETLDFVVGNQIHFGVKTTGMLGEQASLFRTVVDSRKKDVFEKDLFFPRFDKCVACREEAVEGVAFIDRHDFIPDLIAGSVEG